MKRQLLGMRSVQRAKWKHSKSTGKRAESLDESRLSGSHGNLCCMFVCVCGYIITACECSLLLGGAQQHLPPALRTPCNHHRAEQSAAHPQLCDP